jgi:CHAT domain-containing protein
MTGDRGDNIAQAVGYFKNALDLFRPETQPYQCRTTARLLGNIFFEQGRWEGAAQSFEIAAKADEIQYQSTLFRSSKESEIFRSGDLYNKAAFALAKIGKLDAALENLEAGRARMLREALERNRRDLEQLKEMGVNHLYERYRIASQNFEALLTTSDSGMRLAEAYQETTDQNSTLLKIETAQLEMQDAIKAIREVPGFQTFLLSLPAESIKKLVENASLIYLTATPVGGLAMLVKPTSITPIWLDGLSTSTLSDRISGMGEFSGSPGYLSAYTTWRQNPSDEAARRDWMSALDKTTRWMWEICMGEITNRLSGQGVGQAMLIPSGLLGLLPLHAAWTEDADSPAGRRYALDRLNFTYAPNAYALVSAKEAAGRPVDSFLAVGNPDNSFLFASEATAAAATHFDAAEIIQLEGVDATLERVRDEMPNAAVLQFYTHAIANFSKPLESQLFLTGDERLSLRDILGLKLEMPRLAVLAACETSVMGTELPDEVVSLPTGFLQAGVPGIVGSLWMVSDISTMLLLTRFYDLWKSEGRGLVPSEALRQSQIWLRDTSNQEKIEYLHTTETIPEVTVRAASNDLLLEYPQQECSFTHPYYWAAFSFTGI